MSIERIEKRVKTVEDAIVLLTALTDSHNDQLENFLFGLEELKANQKNTDEKMNALIDAQIVTEDKLQRFEAEMRESRKEMQASQKTTETEMRELREDSEKANQKLREESEKGFAELRSTMQDLKQESEKGFSELRTTMQDLAGYMKLVHQRIDKIEEKV